MVMVMVMVAMTVTVVVTGVTMGRRTRRHPECLVQHVHADADDEQEAGGTDARHLGEPHSEAGPEHDIRHPHDDDGRDDMDDRDLNGHDHAAPHPHLPAQEVRNDHELAVSGSERVDDSVGERDGEAEEERTEVIAPFDGVHVSRDFGVRPSLEVEDVSGERLECAAVLFDDFHCLHLGGGLRHCRRCRDEDGQHEHGGQPWSSPTARPIDNHGLTPRTPASPAEGDRTARLDRARSKTGNLPSPRRRRAETPTPHTGNPPPPLGRTC